MGLKKTIKNLAQICFLCHSNFNHNKHIHRIDQNKGYKINNMVVLCLNCKKELVKNKKQVWELPFKNKYLDEYFNFISICSRRIIVKKIIKLRNRMYNKTIEEK